MSLQRQKYRCLCVRVIEGGGGERERGSSSGGEEPVTDKRETGFSEFVSSP